ncbi:hypothetical protein AO268_07315 [Pseudomonas sp. ICMP 8385]|nr:hypothetical protein AO268_07315 [Pseudomonas sp. ICMP 8385]
MIMGAWQIDRSHALCGNAVRDAPRRLREVQDRWRMAGRGASLAAFPRGSVGMIMGPGMSIVPTLCVGMPSVTLRVACAKFKTGGGWRDAERPWPHSHAGAWE